MHYLCDWVILPANPGPKLMEKPMLSGAAKRLTDRQRAVMERIDRRVPIKDIALELGVSETRINQHIRALKAF